MTAIELDQAAPHRTTATLEVLKRSGEGHHRVQRQGQRSFLHGGTQYVDAVSTTGVHDDLSRSERSRIRQSRHHGAEDVVGQGQQHEVGAADHLVGWQQRNSGQQPLRPPHGRIGHPGRRDHGVTGAGERSAQHAADPARRHDTDREPRGAGHRVPHWRLISQTPKLVPVPLHGYQTTRRG